MNYIGIDFSLNSTGFVKYDSCNNVFNFNCVVNTDSFYGKKTNILSQFQLHYELEKLKLINNFKYSRSKPNNDYILDQQLKIKDAIEISKIMLSLIPDNSIVGMEGFAYQSLSRSFVDLIEFNSITRGKIFEKLNSIDIISPSEIKKFATGKGNAKKPDMFNSFISDKHILLKDNPLVKYCQENKNKIIKKENVLKPIEDIVDATFITLFLIEKYL